MRETSSALEIIVSQDPSMKPARPVREALIEAARLEFAERGYAGATTRLIALRAGASEMMLFRYFTSKQNLFKEAVFYPFDTYIKEFIEREVSRETPGKMSRYLLQQFTDELFELLEENRALLLVLVTLFEHNAEHSMGVGDLTNLNSYFSNAESALLRSMEPKYAIPNESAKITVRLVFALIAAVALFQIWLFPDNMIDRLELRRNVQRFLEKAVGVDAP